MAEFKISKILKSNKGQSAVEYILLIALVSSITYIVFNNKKFTSFIKGDAGMFAGMRKGIAYSYRYGREVNTSDDYDAAMAYEYTNYSHEAYLNKKTGLSRFFMNASQYPQ